tara:strand:- start:127 stop:483 length:357 start_codon:yes stop_codon:yes gene_type:complete
MKIVNATITSTQLGYQDHGILTSFIMLDYGGSGQGFGGYCFDEPIKVDGEYSHREGVKFGMEYIRQVLDCTGVRNWEELVGKHVRVRQEHSKVHSIGHILEDKWFCPEDLANEMFGEG